MKKFLLLFISISLAFSASAQNRYVGGDISMYSKYKAASSKYYNTSGTQITDLYAYFKEQGMNMLRVRLFVDPANATSAEKGEGVIQDLDYVKKLGKEIKDNGFKLLLDFHYSDTWADPAKQWTPSAWTSLTEDELVQKMYDYTKDVLQTMKDYGAQPDAIQVGNEVSYGMLWGPVNTASANRKSTSYTNGWQRFANLFNSASKACREECPDANIVLHSELIRNYSLLQSFYNNAKTYNFDYDIIGLSYYPPYHGTIASQLRNAVRWLKDNISGKNVWIVEFAYPAQWALPGTTTYDMTSTYPYTDAGQANLTAAVINELNSWSNVTGLFWWWPEANEYGNTGSQITTSWWNGTLFNNQNGKAFSAITKLKNFNPTVFTGIDGVENDVEVVANENVFTLDGRKVSESSENSKLPRGIYVKNGKKFVVK